MPDSTAFRSPLPAAPPEASAAVPVLAEKVHDYTELPPSLRVEAKETPLFLELLGGGSAYHHFDMPELTREVDSYILESLTRLGLGDTREDYEQVLNSALDKLGLPEGLDVYTTVEKLVRYFRIQHKLFTALKEKEELMAADPLELSASKLKKYLELQHG